MKKINVVLLIVLICLLTACNTIKEYTGTKITKITYSTVDYMGGYTTIYELDFNDNRYSSIGYLPVENEKPESELKNTFTDEEEKLFIDSCYSYGLFDLKQSYEASNIIDGGGWSLLIDYEDGTSKASRGNNAGPDKIFNKCSTVFYDLCGEEVIGILPKYYIYPPQISYAFHYIFDSTNVSTNELTKVARANYKWNKSESLDNDIYELNNVNKEKNKFIEGYSYELVLYTSNYDCNEKFNRITVKEYDFKNELTNENVIYTGKWIKQIELDIKIDKIYVYELSFKDGDYVQYTFSTYKNKE